MTTTTISRTLSATALASALVLASTTAATAAPYTKQFRGEGSSSFGFAWEYARRDARDKALEDGFTAPASQCVEVFAFGSIFSALVIWECTR
jgi:hypothetical protein